MCHNDAGPNNTVFQNEVPVAFIDFDMIAPGMPIEDLGYVAWTWCVSSKPERGGAVHQASQVRVLADEYGFERGARSALYDATLARMGRNVQFWEQIQTNEEYKLTTPEQIVDRIAWTRREIEYMSANEGRFRDALT